MALYEIRVHLEADATEDVDRLVADFEHSICPHPATTDHRCPHRWNITTTRLPDDEAARLEALLND